jgi:hypothetical protein
MHKELNKNIPKEKQDNNYWEFMEKNKDVIPSRIKIFFKKIGNQIILDPLIKLAQITDFQYYISTTYDNLLEDRLWAERGGEYKQIETIDFSINNNSISYSEENLKTVATVFNLMGSIKRINGFAITEEEILEHLYSLTNENQYTKKFFNDIEEKLLLFLGCGFSNWLLRFFIRIISRERLNEAHITKIIADSKTPIDRNLVLFLNHFNSKIVLVPITNSLEFVDKLFEEWKVRKPEGSERKIKYKGVVFLSFSSEDRDRFVDKLYKILDLRGVSVFYDKKKLDAGDYFDPKIKEEISNCKLFIPLISKNSLDPKRYAIKEWNTAMTAEQYFINSGMKKEDDESFIKPFIIDDTKANDERINNIFKHISAKQENQIEKIAEFIISKLEQLD